MSAPNTNSQTLTQCSFTRDQWNNLLHLLNISHFSSICCSQNFSSTSCPDTNGEKDARRERRRDNCGNVKTGVELGLACCDKFFDCAKSNCIGKSGDTQSTLPTRLEEYRETFGERTQSRRSVEFSSAAKRFRDGQEYEETRSGRKDQKLFFESRTSAGGTEKLPFSENLSISSWSYEDHAKKCGTIISQEIYKVSTPCIDDHHFKEEELKSVGNLSKVCSQIALKCLYLARIGRLIFMVSEQTCTIDHKMDQSMWHHVVWSPHIHHTWEPYVCSNQLNIGWENTVRNKLQFRTVQQNQKSFLWMQDRTWFMGSDRRSSWKHASES